MAHKWKNIGARGDYWICDQCKKPQHQCANTPCDKEPAMEFIDIAKLLCEEGVSVSRSEARRRVGMHGVKVNGAIIGMSDPIPTDATIEIKKKGEWVKIK